MLPTCDVRCPRCLVMLQAPRIARFPRCNLCGEQLTCEIAARTSPEDELRALQEWLRALTIRFDQLVLDLRWAREHWEAVAAAELAKQTWPARLKELAWELGWIAAWTWLLPSPFMLLTYATLRLLIMFWTWHQRSKLPVVDEAAEHAARRRRVMDRGGAP